MDPFPGTLREYSVEDLTAAVSLWYRAWHEESPGVRHEHPFEDWRTKWRNAIVPTSSIWVVTMDGLLAGYAILSSTHARYTHVVVHPECRRRGVGPRLVGQLKAISPDGLTVWPNERDAAARAFYAMQGFVPGKVENHPRTGVPQIEYTWHPSDPQERSWPKPEPSRN